MTHATSITPPHVAPSILDRRYRLLEPIGQGGIGAVYKAEHIWMRRIVAVKLLRPEVAEAEEVIQRFSREARLAAKLNDPRCVTVHDFGQAEDGTLYLAMEFLEGQNLRERIDQKKRLPLPEALRIMEALLGGLGAAHRTGVIHRDIKPENIMLVPQEDGSEALKILDFGIAKVPPELQNQTQVLTRTGFAVGTPDYIAPEQALGRDVDGRADLYAAAIIFYELLTGTRPFVGDNTLEILTAHVTAPPPSIRKQHPQVKVPLEVEHVLLKALSKSPEDRYPDGETLLAALVAAARQAGEDVGYLKQSSLEMIPPPPPLPPTNLSALHAFWSPLATLSFWKKLRQGGWRAPEALGRLIGLGSALALLAALIVFLLPDPLPSHAAAALPVSEQPSSAPVAAACKKDTEERPVALPIAPEESPLDLSAAEELIKKRELAEASKLLNQIITEHPTSAEAYMLLAQAEARRDMWDEARIAFHIARILDPSIEISREVVESAIETLGERASKARDAKIFLMKEIGPLAAPLIAERLKSSNARLRVAAAKALGEIGPRPEYDALPDLLEALASAETCSDRANIVRALGTFGDPRALDALRAELAKGTDRKDPNACLKKDLPKIISKLEKAKKQDKPPAPEE